MEFSDESLIKLALFYGIATDYLLGLPTTQTDLVRPS